MIEKIRYTKTGNKILVYEFEGMLHKKIILEKNYYKSHIKQKHPEITKKIILKCLIDPDYVTKQSKSKKEHFYQKKIDNVYYFVVITANLNIKNIRFIKTAYSISDKDYLSQKNKHYMYKKEN